MGHGSWVMGHEWWGGERECDENIIIIYNNITFLIEIECVLKCVFVLLFYFILFHFERENNKIIINGIT